MGGQFESFIDSHSGATSWFWSLGDGYQANLDSAVYYQYNIPGTYIVTLWANNRFGCMTSYSGTIYVIQGIFIPNVFTPNGDGQNDVFHVTVGGMQTYHIEIFNRWGQKVFMTDSPSTDWDGTSTSGVQESDGNYYYEISATDYKNKPYTFHGYLQLIRD
jgi:gliding motility-associated-like protein